MIKTTVKILVIIAIGIACTKVNGQNIAYNLKGKVGEYAAPAKAYLMYVKGSDRHVDSASINKGAFTLMGTLDSPGPATLFISTKGLGFMSYDVGFVNLYLEAGNIAVTGRDSLQNAKIAGGPLNKDYGALKLALKGVEEKLDKVNNVFFTAPPEKQKLTKFRDSIIKETFLVEDEKKIVALSFIKSHPSSMVSLSALEEYAGIYPDSRFVEPAFNLLSANVRLSKAGLKYAAEITRMKKTAIGAVAPDFTLSDTSGKAVSLHDFKGKYVLIDFWASWCEPCRAENPNLLKAFNLYKGKNFTILSVSADVANARDKWLKAVHDDHMIWTQVADLKKGPKNDASIFYGVDNIPQNFLVGPDGKIVDKNLRGDDLAVKLQKLIGQ
jgi:peroxiredoxin